MENKEVVKLVVGVVASSGAGMIVNHAINLTTPPDLSITKKVLVTTGAVAISGLVASHAATYAGEQVDFAFELFSKIKDNRTKSF